MLPIDSFGSLAIHTLIGSECLFLGGGDPCVSAPCKNGGTCVKTGEKTFKCTCVSPYIGDVCDQKRGGDLVTTTAAPKTTSSQKGSYLHIDYLNHLAKEASL